MKLKYILFLIFSLTEVFRGYTQTYNFRNYSEENGLNDEYIYCISQSSNGFLHLSTGEGLCIFDGTNFKTYKNKIISGNFVTTHYIDSKGTVWLGHNQNGVSCFKEGKFFHLKSDQLKDHKVTHITEDIQNNIWVSTLGGGLFRIDVNMNVACVSPEEIKEINWFCFIPGGEIIVGTSDGLKLLKRSGGNKTELIHTISFFDYKNVKQVIPASEKASSFWILVEGEGVYKIERNGLSFTENLHIQNELNSEKQKITCLFADQAGNLWVGLFGEGIRKVILDNKNNSSFTVLKMDKNNGLKNQYIQSIYQDNEGNMWFGTFGGGLIEKPIEKFSFFGAKEGLQRTNIKKLVNDDQGNLWIGTDKGLCYFDKTTNSFHFFDKNNGFVTDRITALHYDSKNQLWIGTSENGVYKYDKSKLKFEDFSKKNKLYNLSVNCIIEKENRILIGTTNGLYSYDTETNETELVTTTNGLLHNNIIDLFSDSRGRIWVSSHGSPPYYIYERKVVPFKNIPGLNSFNINCVTEDKNGNIWIATDGDGVFKYDNKLFSCFTDKNGLLSNYCSGIIADDNNSVWVTHRNGLSEKKEIHTLFNSITNKNGLLFNENNLNAIHKDNYSNLWFGTSQGIVHYDSDMGGNNEVIPRLFITGISLNGVQHPASESIKKKYGYYSLKVDYKAISLTDPQSIKYKYRLLGIDSFWKSTTFSNADFPRLNDGDYVFEVVASNSNGIYSSVPARISLRIEPPIWKKMWFYFLLITMIVILTYVSVYIRINSLKKTQILLQDTVKQKTFLLQREKEEVEKIKVELEHKNKDITDSINYAKRIQDSLLPPESLMNKLFLKKYFVLYKPKDIVSGDFYWSAPLKINEQVTLSLAAVVDCTGHGVPGAFLSIVANDFLKQSLNTNHGRRINEILDQLNKSIISTLNQSSDSKIKVKDGMDIALIGIDYSSQTLYYSGANNPVYIFRKVSEKAQLTILHPTKQAIGLINENISNYESCEFDLLPGDNIYLFSDGYADQFGGNDDKKLNYRRFKEILSQACELPIGLQRNFLEKKFEEWRKTTDQTDDVCVMGIRI
ncbi:MAG: hypothetical protein K0S32_3202 [Bacteroidetes bacterium]|jgi:ligand-binding sensor domain-containing protein/serine phosphatase RsbU (regulator of sigma subunit)|nr:hypothetical protein [Bacteroidota bacterium]